MENENLLLDQAVTTNIVEFSRHAFGRQMRGAVGKTHLELHSPLTQAAFRRGFALFTRNVFFAVDAPRGLPGFDEAPCDQIDAMLKKKLTETSRYIDGKTTQLWAMLNAQGVANDASFPMLMKQEVLIASPQARTYIAILHAADAYMTLCWSAYLAGAMTARERHGQEIDIRKRLRALTNLARELKFRMYKFYERWRIERARTESETPAAKRLAADLADAPVEAHESTDNPEPAVLAEQAQAVAA